MNYVFVPDPKKESAKSYALGRAGMAQREASQLMNAVQGLISQLDCAVSGAPSGMDRALIGWCQQALSELSAAQTDLRYAEKEISALEPGDWVPEEVVRREEGWT